MCVYNLFIYLKTKFLSLRLPREFITSVSWTGFNSATSLAQIWAKPGRSTFRKLARCWPKSVQKLHLVGQTVTASNRTFLRTI